MNKKTNVICILSDDHGAWAMGCAGNKEIRTPHLDRLAREGVRYDNFFCTSPVCSPARASLLTGRIPSQHGIHDWLFSGNGPHDPESVGEEATGIEYLQGMTGYTDILAKNGYVCGITGKWHLGNSYVPQKGFSHWVVTERGAGPYYNSPIIRDGIEEKTTGYLTDVITEEAMSFIRNRHTDTQPFYLSVNYTNPHRPWKNNHPKELIDSYEDCRFDSIPLEKDHPWIITTPERENVSVPREDMKVYFAAVTAMDICIGKIMDLVEQLGIREETLIVYMGDNGFNLGHHGIWGKGNGTLPINMYDTSVKVPAIFSQPGLIPQNNVSKSLVSGYDFMPTLLEYLNLENPESDSLPGESFLGDLLGQEQKSREHVVVFDEYGPVRMVRTNQWKYVHRFPYGPHELFDLENDSHEKTNLYGQSDKLPIQQELKAALDNWFVRYVDPMLDGTHEEVDGGGQQYLAGPRGQGRPAYRQRERTNKLL
jgi:arylsulfatase A-like enzyme